MGGGGERAQKAQFASRRFSFSTDRSRTAHSGAAVRQTTRLLNTRNTQNECSTHAQHAQHTAQSQVGRAHLLRNRRRVILVILLLRTLALTLHPLTQMRKSLLVHRRRPNKAQNDPENRNVQRQRALDDEARALAPSGRDSDVLLAQSGGEQQVRVHGVAAEALADEPEVVVDQEGRQLEAFPVYVCMCVWYGCMCIWVYVCICV